MFLFYNEASYKKKKPNQNKVNEAKTVENVKYKPILG